MQILTSSLDETMLTSNDPKVRYRPIYEDKNDVDKDIVCDVCLDDLIEDNEDELVLCDLCNSAVHQKCYGNEILNQFPEEEQWFCQRCKYLKANP